MADDDGVHPASSESRAADYRCGAIFFGGWTSGLSAARGFQPWTHPELRLVSRERDGWRMFSHSVLASVCSAG